MPDTPQQMAAGTVCDLLWRRSSRSARMALDVDGDARAYRDISVAATALASALVNAGIKRGDRIVLLAANSLEWVTWIFGALAAGAAIVPLPTRWRRREIGHVLKDCTPVLVVSDEEVSGNPLADTVLEIIEADFGRIERGRVGAFSPIRFVVGTGAAAKRDDVTTIDRFLSDFGGSAAGARSLPAIAGNDAALIQYTSGTTAFPKGAVLPHRGLVACARATAERMGLTKSSRFFCPQPFFYTGGLPAGLLVGMAAGCTTFSQRLFDPERALDVIEKYRCTHHAGVAAMYAMEYEHPKFDRARVASLTVMRNSGRPQDLWRQYEVMGGRPTNTYGLTEACSNVAMADHRDPLECAIETCGRPLGGVNVRIVGEGGRSITSGSAGEIQVRGNSLIGYWPLDRPHGDEPMMTEGWLKTGDLGMLDELGRLHFLGRIKQQIRVGGHNVSPLEVEDVLGQHPAVKQAVVFGLPDDRLEESVAAVLELKPGASVSDADLIRFMKSQIASYKVPKRFERVDALPLQAGFKIDRRLLRDSLLAKSRDGA